TAAFGIDSLAQRDRVFRRLGLQARGFADSLEWNGGVAMGNAVPSTLSGGGHWWRRGDTQLFAVETLDARLATGRWRLDTAAVVTLSDSAPAVTPLVLEAEDGSGRVTVGGRVPGEASGALSVSGFGIALQDLYGLVQRDTAGVGGTLGFTFKLGGTAREPTAEGRAWLEDAVFGDFHAPFARTEFKYGDRRFDAQAGLVRTGAEMLSVNADLPLDLGFKGVERRQLDGPLTVRARGQRGPRPPRGRLPGHRGCGGAGRGRGAGDRHLGASPGQRVRQREPRRDDHPGDRRTLRGHPRPGRAAG
ncbi:MAG TPA: hypothetical protein VEU27_08480, partial [Gemmatimonadales bacterium]|nr:hypothetical protein [Gemmatimonadales bacterium]